jgi:DNA-binding PadR family transcriptional regulator
MPAYDIEALASLSRTVPSMGKKGLVRRRKGDADDRRVSVSITPRGWRVFKKLSRASKKIYGVRAAELGAARLREFNRGIDVVTKIHSPRHCRARRLRPRNACAILPLSPIPLL